MKTKFWIIRVTGGRLDLMAESSVDSVAATVIVGFLFTFIVSTD